MMDRFILLEKDSGLLLASPATPIRSHVAVLCSLDVLQDVSLFKEGTAPSEALKLMAETGDLSALLVSTILLPPSCRHPSIVVILIIINFTPTMTIPSWLKSRQICVHR